jgi:cyclic-di-GMP phosphodiesterase TipF (flagellum assembly factor)
MTIMPSLFWLALLLGYLTGVAAAVLLLPAPLIEPLYGPLALTTVVVTAAFGALLQLRRVRQNGASARTAAPQQPAPGARRRRALTDEAAGPDAGGLSPDERARAEDERWPLMVRLEAPGVIGPGELRQILYQGLVDLRLRGVASLAQPEAALYYASPRLRSVDGQPLEPASYRTTAARAGLLGTIDRLLLLRCVDMLRAARAERAVTVLCGIAAASLNDPGFVAELEQQLSDDPALAASLVLSLDQMPCDRPGVLAAHALQARGLRFGLRRLGPPQLDPAALRAAGIAFVLLDAERLALAPDGTPDPTLLELQQPLGPDGPQLLVSRRDADSVTLAGAGPGSPEQHPVELARPSAA